MTSTRVGELARRLKPILGRKIDTLYAVWLSDSSASGRAEIEQTLEMLTAKHLGTGYEPDRTPFPPPPEEFCRDGELELGHVAYAGKDMHPFRLNASRLKEHLLVAGRSGSGKTNLTFVLAAQIMGQGIKLLALDWKRGYRNLLQIRSDLRVYTIGRSLSPFAFNPLIPPPNCEPGIWLKLITDVIAGAYLGGEGVISLLIKGIDRLYREHGVHDGNVERWPTIKDLLAWLTTTKLTGRAAMWKASAERILMAMTYGEFASVINTQDNRHVQQLLSHNVVMEMDGLSSSSDRVMFSEALMLYLYRYRLAQGPQSSLSNVIVLEEAHNLLLAKQAGARESFLETSIRMIREYGVGYVFVDQSASMLSKVAFSNSYATLALSQKLQADLRAMGSAMNLTEDQKQALSTLPVGSAVVRLADEHPEAFLVRVPRSRVVEGQVDDDRVRDSTAIDGEINSDHASPNDAIPTESKCFGDSGGSGGISGAGGVREEITAIQPADKNSSIPESTCDTIHPTRVALHEHTATPPAAPRPPPLDSDDHQDQDPPVVSRDTVRFLTDIVRHPLATTVNRYERLRLSRRRGNAIREQLHKAGLICPVPLPTRSGQIVLTELTDEGQSICRKLDIDTGIPFRTSLEHAYWAKRARRHYERLGYDVEPESPVAGNGIVDLIARSPNEQLQIELETGKSNILANLTKAHTKGFDRIVLIATNASAAAACHRAVAKLPSDHRVPVELLTWLDLSS